MKLEMHFMPLVLVWVPMDGVPLAQLSCISNNEIASQQANTEIAAVLPNLIKHYLRCLVDLFI